MSHRSSKPMPLRPPELHAAYSQDVVQATECRPKKGRRSVFAAVKKLRIIVISLSVGHLNHEHVVQLISRKS